MSSQRPPHIEARIEFVTTEAGGRKGFALSGYRPQFYYHGQNWDAEQTYPEAEKVFPGDTVKAHLRFLSPKSHFGNIDVGMPFLVREGVRTVAFGIVTQIFDQLAQDSMQTK